MPGRGLRSPAADSQKIAKVRGRLSRKIAKVRGRLSRAARPRPSTGLQTGLHTTGLDIMSHLFHHPKHPFQEESAREQARHEESEAKLAEWWRRCDSPPFSQ
ncbi:unnamed protein product [Boreogadus saida]